MKVFDPFVSKYPPDNNLRKPTAETLEQFQRESASGTSEILAGIWFRKLWRRFAENY